MEARRYRARRRRADDPRRSPIAPVESSTSIAICSRGIAFSAMWPDPLVMTTGVSGSADKALLRQLSGYPKALGMAGAVMLARSLLPGTHTTEPTFGLPATWIDAALKKEASLQGYTIVDAATVLSTHLTELLKGNIADRPGFCASSRIRKACAITSGGALAPTRQRNGRRSSG
jgi:FHIPEP family protein